MAKQTYKLFFAFNKHLCYDCERKIKFQTMYVGQDFLTEYENEGKVYYCGKCKRERQKREN
jgi:hypothetical protein